MLKEFELITKIRKGIAYGDDVVKGIGDDCAVIKAKDGYLLYTIDNMVEDVHFSLTFTKPKNVGYKAVVRAVSDIAAMGGKPMHILVSLALSDKADRKLFNEILAGVKWACKLYKIDLIGGDITKSKALTLTITVIGKSKDMPILRSGAEVGQKIYVTGELGLARAGLKLLQEKTKMVKRLITAYEMPKARIELGQALLKERIARAMIDISDGLLGDLSHILEESRKGAVIDLKKLPIPQILLKNFPKPDCLNFVLNGGDDYELIFTAEEKDWERLSKLANRFNVPITEIGTITKSGFYLLDGAKKTKITPHSYEHQFNA